MILWRGATILPTLHSIKQKSIHSAIPTLIQQSSCLHKIIRSNQLLIYGRSLVDRTAPNKASAINGIHTESYYSHISISPNPASTHLSLSPAIAVASTTGISSHPQNWQPEVIDPLMVSNPPLLDDAASASSRFHRLRYKKFTLVTTMYSATSSYAT